MNAVLPVGDIQAPRTLGRSVVSRLNSFHALVCPPTTVRPVSDQLFSVLPYFFIQTTNSFRASTTYFQVCISLLLALAELRIPICQSD